MARPFSLQPLLELMQERTDDASRQLGQLIAAEQNARSRLELLEQYRNEYAERMLTAASEGISPLSLANYREFMGRIDEAIEQQRQNVRNSELNTAQGQEDWKAANQKLKALDTLSQRHDARERYREAKQDQKLQDEFSSRKYATPEPKD